MAESAPRVSVILPTYNRRALLQQTVESVLAQTFADWELVIVDDGSTDDTRAYVENLVDARIRPLWLTHAGSIAGVRNVGVARSRGEWLAFLDSDDLWLPRKLETQLAALHAAPSCGWSYTHYSLIDDQGQPYRHDNRPPYQPNGDILHDLLTYKAAAAIITCMVHRNTAMRAGPFDTNVRFSSDYEWVLRLSIAAKTVAVPDMLAWVRVHSNRTTRQRKRPYEQTFAIFHKTLTQTLTNINDPVAINLCRKQCAWSLVSAAYDCAMHGERARAWQHLRSALTFDRPTMRWGRVALRTLVGHAPREDA